MVIVAAFAALWMCAAFAQSGEPATASISGRVVNASTGVPMRKVTVTLVPSPGRGYMGQQQALMQNALTDAAGEFEFRPLAAGTFTLTASHPLNSDIKVQSSVEVQPGHSVAGVRLKLAAPAVISGRVIDEEGDPVLRANVEAVRVTRMQTGQRNPRIAGFTTDDTGSYRLFGLEPGRYRVVASVPGKPDSAYPFHPSTADSSGAQVVVAAAGQEVSGIDIRMQKAPLLRISGQVIPVKAWANPGNCPEERSRNFIRGFVPGQAMERPQCVYYDVALFFRGQGASGPRVGWAEVGAGNRFEIRNVFPGSYLLVAVLGNRPVGRVPIEVTSKNLDNVSIPLVATVSLVGKMRRDGADPHALFGNVSLTPTEPGMPEPSVSQVSTDGRFEIKDISPDRYHLSVGAGWVKSVMLAGKETGVDLDLRSAADNDVLEITIAVTHGVAEVFVVDEEGKLLTDSPFVALVPDTSMKLRQTFHLVRADRMGRATFFVPPGSYRAFAFGDNPGFDLESFDGILGKGARLEVKANSTERVSVHPTPRGDLY